MNQCPHTLSLPLANFVYYMLRQSSNHILLYFYFSVYEHLLVYGNYWSKLTTLLYLFIYLLLTKYQSFSNNCSSFKWFQSSLTHFFETKNVNCVLVVKRFLYFPITAPVSEQNCTIFILGSYLFQFHHQYTAKADYQL